MTSAHAASSYSNRFAIYAPYLDKKINEQNVTNVNNKIQCIL